VGAFVGFDFFVNFLDVTFEAVFLCCSVGAVRVGAFVRSDFFVNSVDVFF